MRNSFSNMLSYAAALQCVETWAEKRYQPSCFVPLEQAVGRIAAEKMLATASRPETDISAMDGYAFAHDAMLNAKSGLAVSGVTVAGEKPPPLPIGYAQKILTGATIPQGVDCVMAVERMTQLHYTDHVKPLQTLADKGANIRRAGEEFRKGDQLIQCGQRLDWRHIALLACQKIQTIAVRAPLRIALVANGGELSCHAPDFRADSNTPMLVAMLEALGAEVTPFLVASDDQAVLASTLQDAWQVADVIVTTGGISVGMTDNVVDAFLSLNARALFRGVKMRPGKPISLFEKQGKLAFCLPGNPGASALCAQVLLVPYLRRRVGRQAFPQHLFGKVEFTFTALPETTHFLPVAATQTSEGYIFTLLKTVGASDIKVLSQAVGFLQVNPSETIHSGQFSKIIGFSSN